MSACRSLSFSPSPLSLWLLSRSNLLSVFSPISIYAWQTSYSFFIPFSLSPSVSDFSYLYLWSVWLSGLHLVKSKSDTWSIDWPRDLSHRVKVKIDKANFKICFQHVRLRWEPVSAYTLWSLSARFKLTCRWEVANVKFGGAANGNKLRKNVLHESIRGVEPPFCFQGPDQTDTYATSNTVFLATQGVQVHTNSHSSSTYTLL